MKAPCIGVSILVAGYLLSACGGGSAPPPTAPGVATKAAVAAATGDAGVPIDALGYTYNYNPLGKRDPFRSPIEEIQARPEGNSGCTEPLCQWDLDQLKLVAVVTGDANPLAMVEDPQTRGYIIRRGSKVGKQGGQVTQILRDSLTVTEYFSSPDGKRNPNAVTMRLKPDTQVSPTLDLLSGKNVQ
jgi:type IV pilus assembly protein PilP